MIVLGYSISSYSQYRWEVSAGPTISTFNMDIGDSSSKVGFYVNVGYGYVSGVRAKTSIVFSLDLMQRNSEINNLGDVSALQIGFNPKFRYLFNRGKDEFRPLSMWGHPLELIQILK